MQQFFPADIFCIVLSVYLILENLEFIPQSIGLVWKEKLPVKGLVLKADFKIIRLPPWCRNIYISLRAGHDQNALALNAYADLQDANCIVVHHHGINVLKPVTIPPEERMHLVVSESSKHPYDFIS